MKALDKVTDNEKKKSFLFPGDVSVGTESFSFLWSAKYEHHGAFGLGLGYSNAA